HRIKPVYSLSDSIRAARARISPLSLHDALPIFLVSSQIPDPIEPAFLKDKNDEIVDDYSNAAKQVIDNPLIVAEMVAQSVSDTVEEEGAMFATGEALTALIPVAGGLKYAK